MPHVTSLHRKRPIPGRDAHPERPPPGRQTNLFSVHCSLFSAGPAPAGPAYPFRPAEAMPWMMYFWKYRKMMKGGMMAMTAMAKIFG